MCKINMIMIMIFKRLLFPGQNTNSCIYLATVYVYPVLVSLASYLLQQNMMLILCIFKYIQLESRDQDDNNKDGLSAVIIGGAIGGGVVFIVIFIFLCTVIWLRKRSKQDKGLYVNPQSR